MNRNFLFVAAVCAASLSTAAIAGEIRGPRPDSNLPDDPSISNGLSRCSFSGLNDTPDGIPMVDPGGPIQSYGYFMSHFDLFDPSDPDQRADFAFPGQGCNPQRTGGSPDHN